MDKRTDTGRKTYSKVPSGTKVIDKRRRQK